MDIYEALEKLTGFLDDLTGWAGHSMSDDELNELGEVENTIYQFVRKHEPREGF